MCVCVGVIYGHVILNVIGNLAHKLAYINKENTEWANVEVQFLDNFRSLIHRIARHGVLNFVCKV